METPKKEPIKHEVLPKEEWRNIYDPEAEKGFKKSKPKAYYESLMLKFFPLVQKLYNDDMGEKYEAIDIDDEDSVVITTSITLDGESVTEPTRHPFVCFQKCEGQQRGGFELAFIVREKSTGNVTQALAYFSPAHTGIIDVSWDRKGDEARYRWN